MTSSTHSQQGIAHLGLIALVVIAGIGVVLFATGRFSLPTPANLKQMVEKSSSSRSSVFTALMPNPIKDKAVSAKISAKDGGELKLTDAKGIETTLVIPPTSLKNDTTITLSPLSQVPIEGYTSSLSNGVLIEPAGVKFSPPAVLVFNFKPGNNSPSLFGAGSSANTAPSTNLPASSNDEQKQVEEQKDYIKKLWQSGQMLGVSDNRLTPTIDTTGLQRVPTSAGIVYTNTNNGSVGLAPSQVSSDGTYVSTPVAESGAYTPDDISSEKAKDHAENSATSVSIACTMTNLAALNKALSGNASTGETLAYRGTLRECLDEKIAELEYRCKNDPMKVRHLEFSILQALAQKFFGNTDRDDKLRKIMVSCTREYKIGGYGSNGPSTLTIQAKVCGFIDDTWNGSDKFHIQVGPGFLDYSGSSSFTPPAFGGGFQVTGQGNTVATGLSYAYSGAVANAYFDNEKTFTFAAPASVVVKTPIVLVGNACSSKLPNETDTLPPIEPLPDSQ